MERGGEKTEPQYLQWYQVHFILFKVLIIDRDRKLSSIESHYMETVSAPAIPLNQMTDEFTCTHLYTKDEYISIIALIKGYVTNTWR